MEGRKGQGGGEETDGSRVKPVCFHQRFSGMVPQEILGPDYHSEAGCKLVGFSSNGDSEVSFSLPVFFDIHSPILLHSWFKQFLAIQGTSVLANTLNNISRKGLNR